MSKCKKSHIVLCLLAVLLFAAPLIPSTSRSKYLYLVINILIIALGAEAGLISSLSKPLEDKKMAASSDTEAIKQLPRTPSNEVKKVRVVEKSRSVNVVRVQAEVDRVKKCPSMPSIFFIGGGDQAHELEALEDVAEENDSNSYKKKEVEVEMEMEDFEDGGKELFTKTEMFIGNFYKQLKMQREDSWKRIHGFYKKSF